MARRYRRGIISSMADRHSFLSFFSLSFYLSIFAPDSSSGRSHQISGAYAHKGREIERARDIKVGSAGRESGRRDGGRLPLQTVGMAELVYQSLAALRLLHDALLVVLPDAAAELVVVHRGPVLPLAPEPRHAHRVLDLEDPFAAVQPAYAGAVDARALQQLLQELPQVDVAAAVAHLAAAVAAVAAVITPLGGGAILVLVCRKSRGRKG